MKKLLLIAMVMGLFTLFLPTEINAQSCCAAAAKALCQKVCGDTKEKSAETKSASLESTKTTSSATKPVVQAGVASAVMVTTAYLVNQFGTLISKMSNDPCCAAKACEPAECDLSKCDPAKCKTN